MGAGQMGFEPSRKLLASYGIPVLGRLVPSLAEALGTAADEGYPVVLKAVSSRIIHKTDVGVVCLGLKSPHAVEEAYHHILENVGRAGFGDLEGVLVQPMAERGFEFLVGAKQDPCFGPLTMVGYGGRFVELFQDVAPGIGLLGRQDVTRMLSETMAGRILDGFRGPRLDKDYRKP